MKFPPTQEKPILKARARCGLSKSKLALSFSPLQDLYCLTNGLGIDKGWFETKLYD